MAVMINSFRRMRTGKPDGRESGRGRERKRQQRKRRVRDARGLVPQSGMEQPESPEARKPESPEARRLSSHGERRAAAEHTWRAQRSPTPKKQLFCCAAVLLSFCGPGLRPCRLWHSSSSHRSRRPRKAHWRAQRSPHRSRRQQQQQQIPAANRRHPQWH